MNDFQLQTEINDSTRREIDSHNEKRIIESEIENERANVKKGLKKFVTFTGYITFFLAFLSYALNEPFNYIVFFSMLSVSLFFDVIKPFVKLRRKKQNFEVWNETPQE